MPKDDKRKELTQEEIDAQNEKFRTFFSTSVAQVPEEMKRRDEEKENTGSSFCTAGAAAGSSLSFSR